MNFTIQCITLNLKLLIYEEEEIIALKAKSDALQRELLDLVAQDAVGVSAEFPVLRDRERPGQDTGLGQHHG